MTPHAPARPAPADGEIRNLREQLDQARASVDRHQAELVRARRELAETQEERDQAVNRAAELEEDRANLAKLLVASTALHTSGDREEMLCALQEIVINLVGSEEFGIYEVAGDGLALVVGFGIDGEERGVLPLDGVYAHVRDTGEIYVDIEREHPGRPAACIPLCLAGQVTAMIVVFEYLSQKFETGAFDYELYDLLGCQVAPALLATAGGVPT